MHFYYAIFQHKTIITSLQVTDCIQNNTILILQCFCECMYVYHTTFRNKFHTFYCIISTKDLFNQIIPIYTFSENITAEFCIFLTKLCITARSENLNSNQSRLFLKTFWFGTTAWVLPNKIDNLKF